MNKILLLNPPGSRKFLRDQYCSSSAKADYYWPAVDLLVLSGILSEHFELELFDAIVQRVTPENIIEKIVKNGYYAVISLSSTASRNEDFVLFEQIKARSKAIIVLNGGFLRDDPRKYLNQCFFIDAIITDYIETGIVDFLRDNPGPYGGLWYRAKGRIIACADPAKHVIDFAYPVPRHDLLDLASYSMPQTKNKKFTCCLISYGCKFACAYCSSGSIGFKLRNIENIIKELKAVKALGISEVHFPDFTFTADPGHCRKLCGAMIAEKLELSWDCLTRADCFDFETAMLMKEAGAHTIQFGIETQNEQLLKKMAKPISNEQVKRCFDICRRLNLRTIGFFIIGLPGEDESSIKKSIDFACELDCDYAAFSIYVPDYGSALRKEMESRVPELNSIDQFDRTMYPVIDNQVLTKERIWQLRNYALKKFYLRPKYIWGQIKKLNNFAKIKSVGKIGYSMIRGN